MSRPNRLGPEDYVEIEMRARILFRKYLTGYRGQTVTVRDGLDYWIMVATEEHLNAAAD